MTPFEMVDIVMRELGFKMTESHYYRDNYFGEKTMFIVYKHNKEKDKFALFVIPYVSIPIYKSVDQIRSLIPTFLYFTKKQIDEAKIERNING